MMEKRRSALFIERGSKSKDRTMQFIAFKLRVLGFAEGAAFLVAYLLLCFSSLFLAVLNKEVEMKFVDGQSVKFIFGQSSQRLLMGGVEYQFNETSTGICLDEEFDSNYLHEPYEPTLLGSPNAILFS